MRPRPWSNVPSAFPTPRQKASAPADTLSACPRVYQARILCLLGALAAQREPNIELARDHYQHALSIADALGLRPLQAHAHLGLGTLYAGAGRREPACAALFAASELYRAMWR